MVVELSILATMSASYPSEYMHTSNKTYTSTSLKQNLKQIFVLARPPDIPEILWFEEENELIRSCAALSSALGLQKSFSTSDISQLPSPDEPTLALRSAVSDLVLTSIQRTGYLLDHPRYFTQERSYVFDRQQIV